MWARDLQGCSQVLKFGERFEHEARCAFKPIEAEEKKKAEHERAAAENPGQTLPYLPELHERPSYAYVIVARRRK